MVLQDNSTGRKYQVFVNNAQLGFREVLNYNGVYVPGVVQDSTTVPLPLTREQLLEYLLLFYPSRRLYGPSTDNPTWEILVNDIDISIEEHVVSPTLTWMRDEIDPNVVWELKVDNTAGLYLLEVIMEGKGRVVFVNTGTLTTSYNVTGTLSLTISDLESGFLDRVELMNTVNQTYSLDCLIPQEELS